VKLIVYPGEDFTCPFCGARYFLGPDDPDDPWTGGAVCSEGGFCCPHIDLEIVPTGGDAWEVYFIPTDIDLEILSTGGDAWEVYFTQTEEEAGHG
jgi:hypothetical protein